VIASTWLKMADRFLYWGEGKMLGFVEMMFFQIGRDTIPQLQQRRLDLYELLHSTVMLKRFAKVKKIAKLRQY